MKKLMVLALVLSVVGLAGAGLSLEGNGTPNGSIVGANNDFPIGGYMFTQKGTIVDPAWTYQGSLRAFDVVTDADLIGFFAENFGPISQLFEVNFADSGTETNFKKPNGTLISFVAGDAPVDVTLVDGDGNLLSSMTLIPEPMTMGLLALGGLFIRRKK